MSHVRHWDWFDLVTGNTRGESEDNLEWNTIPICPHCGKSTEYWEGDIDQDEQGNYIRGWHWRCNPCNLATETWGEINEP